MPRICNFLGISIYMYFNDHAPPHFHAIYGEYAGQIEIETGELLAGKLPPRVKKLVAEWCQLNQEGLNDNWSRARREEDLITLPPLE